MLLELNYDEWFDKFKPLINTLDDNANYDGCMFETYGAEAEHVSVAPANKIWTLVDCDGELFISEGWHFVNRMGYFITEIPFDSKIEYNIYVSYDKEYDEEWKPCDMCGLHEMDWNMSPNDNLICNTCEEEMLEEMEQEHA